MSPNRFTSEDGHEVAFRRFKDDKFALDITRHREGLCFSVQLTRPEMVQLARCAEQEITREPFDV